jgi:hypothetical protein
VIGHMKAEGHLGRCYLKGTAGDAANAILTAVGHNLRLVLAWLRILLRLWPRYGARSLPIPGSNWLLNGRLCTGACAAADAIKGEPLRGMKSS